MASEPPSSTGMGETGRGNAADSTAENTAGNTADSTAENVAGDTTAAAADTAAAAGTADRVVDVDDLTFGYTAAPVVEDISFGVDRGEYVGIVGPNGSGKSTLLRLVLGLHEPDHGECRLLGHPSLAFAERERVGYVAQDVTETTKRMPITVAEAVLMGRFPHAGFGRVTETDREHAREALETVGIERLADRKITALSGGQRQRAYIARALAGEAELLVLDEPTVGVDADSVDAFFELLADLNDHGMTVLLVEHDIGAVLEHASRVICLNREVYFDGSPAAFVESDALDRAYGTNLGPGSRARGGSGAGAEADSEAGSNDASAAGTGTEAGATGRGEGS